MKKVTITAHNGIGPTKVLAGSKTVDQPETFEDADVLGFTEKQIIDGFWDSHVIRVQASLRNGGAPSASAKVASLQAAARTQKAAGDSALFDELVRLKVINS